MDGLTEMKAIYCTNVRIEKTVSKLKVEHVRALKAITNHQRPS